MGCYLRRAQNKVTKKTTPPMAEIHTGERTHHQDQSISPVSLRTIKTMASNPGNPIPPPPIFMCFLVMFSSPCYEFDCPPYRGFPVVAAASFRYCHHH